MKVKIIKTTKVLQVINKDTTVRVRVTRQQLGFL